MIVRPRFDVAPAVATPAGGVLVALVGSPTQGEVPVYDASAGRWAPGAQSGGDADSLAAVQRAATLALYLHHTVI